MKGEVMDTLTAQQKETCRQLNVSPEDFLKTKDEDKQQAFNQKWSDVTPEDRGKIARFFKTGD